MLQLILGRSGYGKSTHVKNEIDKIISNENKNVTLLIPEQLSFVTGNEYLELLGEIKYNKLEIIDFTRLSHEIKRIYGGLNKFYIDNSGRAILMGTAINGVKDSFKLYKKKLGTYSFVKSMLEIYSEIKRNDIDFSQLLQVSNKSKKSILNHKLHDVSLIMGAYSGVIENDYEDVEDDLTRLYEKVSEVEYFNGKTVYIDGFSGFTAQEMKVLQVILKQADKVFVTVCANNLNILENDFSVFSATKQTAMQLINLAKKVNANVLSPILINDENAKKSTSLKSLEKTFLAGELTTCDFCEDIEIYCGSDCYDECDYVARKIKNLLRIGKYRCRDIAVIARDIASYKTILQNAFDNYDIPYFHDARQPVDTQPLVQFISYAIKCVITSFKTENVMSFAKTRLLCVTNEDISMLENYVIMWKISGNRWTEEFTNHPDGFGADFSSADRANLEHINMIRSIIVSPLIKLKKAMHNATTGEMTKAIFAMLIETKVPSNLCELAKELEERGFSALAGEQNRIWELTMDILDQIVMTIGDKNVSVNEFGDLFKLVVSFQDIGVIPQGMDNVFVGSAERSSANHPKITFVIGAIDGIFPSNKSYGGIFSDKDKRTLHEMGIEMFVPNEKIIALEKFIAYTAVTSANEKLFISYYSADLASNAYNPSIIVKEALKAFPRLKVMSRNDYSNIELIEGKKSSFQLAASHWNDNSQFFNSLQEYFLKSHEYNSACCAIQRQNDNSQARIQDTNIAKELFGENMLLSASKTEVYHKCPYMYYCEYGLKAKPRKIAEMDPMQIGLVMHDVFEKLLGKFTSDTLCQMTNDEIEHEVYSILDTYLKENMGDDNELSERFKYLFIRQRKTINFIVLRMIDEFKQSEFKTKAVELAVDNDSTVKPLVITLDDGGTLTVRGKIDRVDMMEKNGEKYIRIVDYKSGIKQFALSDVFFGLNMQMLIYQICVEENGTGEFADTIPAGVLYMPLRRTFKSLSRNADQSAIYDAVTKDLCMGGMVLCDESVLVGMEKNLAGKFIPYSNSARGTKSVASVEQFHLISTYIKALIKEMGNELHHGNIPMKAVFSKSRYDKTCEYCDYSSVCANKLNKEMKIINEYSHIDALKMLEKEDNNDAELDTSTEKCN